MGKWKIFKAKKTLYIPKSITKIIFSFQDKIKQEKKSLKVTAWIEKTRSEIVPPKTCILEFNAPLEDRNRYVSLKQKFQNFVWHTWWLFLRFNSFELVFFYNKVCDLFFLLVMSMPRTNFWLAVIKLTFKGNNKNGYLFSSFRWLVVCSYDCVLLSDNRRYFIS